MTHSQTQGAEGAGTKTAGRIAHDAAYGLSPDSQLWQGQTEGVRDFWNRAGAAVVSALSTPAPATTPGVPDSVRALSEAASEDWDTNDATPYILGPQIDGEHDRFEVIARGPHGHAKSGDAIRKWQANRMFAVAAVNHVRALIAAQPAGQSTDDDTSRCEACNKPLIAGQRVMQDVELGTVHAACCGPEREAYVKDVETGEPLGPNDPIPHGYVYEGEEPAGQAGDAGARIAEIVNRWHDWIVSASADMDQPEWSSGSRQTMEDDRDFLLRALPAQKPAPDSARTGPVETERQALEKLYDFACTHPNAVGEKAAEIDAAYRALAASPEAPSDAGWSFDMEAAPRDGTPVIVAVTSIHEGHEPIVGQAFIDTDNGGHWWWAGTSYGDYYASPIHETNNPPYAWHSMLNAPTPPSDPAPSGQAEG